MSRKGFSAEDARLMRRALKLAERGVGETNPNPAVGCVLVRDGRVVGEAFHARAGSPHAEARALAASGARARGATAYVTLEPCAPNRLKRTPPCAPLLIAAGIRRVVFGVRDRNPNVRGQGARLLRSAGIVVVQGVCASEAGRLTQHFNAAMKSGRPFVTLKAGMTLDGRIATAAGESRWITSVAQRRAARFMRRLFDGVLVGIGTVLADNPVLLPRPRTRRPFVRVVLDSRLRLPLGSNLVETAGRNPLMVVCARAAPVRKQALEDRGVIVIEAGKAGGRVLLPRALRALFARGLTSLMVEGGSEVLGAFVRAGLFDEFVVFRAPMVLGGRSSRAAVGGEDPASLKEAVRLRRANPAISATLRYGVVARTGVDVEVYEKVRP